VIKSLAHQLAMIAYDLEKALLEIHSNLSVYTIAAYFTSWPVWHHIVDWAPRVVREMIQQKHPMIVQVDERAAVQFLHRQMWAYAQEVKRKSACDASGSSEADSVATMKPQPSSDEGSIPAGTPVRGRTRGDLRLPVEDAWGTHGFSQRRSSSDSRVR
jgi:hypothetical protein